MPAIEEQKAMPSEEVVPPIGQAGIGENNKPLSYFVSKRKMDLGENKNNALLMGGAVAAAALVGVFMLSHTDKPGERAAEHPKQATMTKPAAKSSAGFTPGDKASTSTDPAAQSETTASDIENTKGHSGETQGSRLPYQTGGAEKDSRIEGGSGLGSPSRGRHGSLNSPSGNRPPALNSVPPFQPPSYQSATQNSPYVGSAPSTTEQVRAYAEEVTKPSMIFAAQITSNSAANPSVGAVEPITNFGLVTGFHVSAHLEASVSTVGGAPAVAVIEYNCMQDGAVIIPAGSRVIGKIVGASSTGLVNMSFSEIFLPNGTRAPISAVGLDQYLHQIKGNVTGKNTGKQFLLASLTSVGSLGAGFFGNNNSGTITQSGLAREQLASNIGNAGDQSIQRLQVSQSIVVTVPSGTLIYVTFIAPVKGTIQQAAANAANPR